MIVSLALGLEVGKVFRQQGYEQEMLSNGVGSCLHMLRDKVTSQNEVFHFFVYPPSVLGTRFDRSLAIRVKCLVKSGVLYLVDKPAHVTDEDMTI